jgi:hypothetical protein
MKQYLDAVDEILTVGTRKENRTGVDTLSTFGIMMKFDLSSGDFPLLTTKKVSWKNIVVENLWFLSGEPKIDLLKKHKCKFWDAWADEDGFVPSAYGNFWRRFPVHGDLLHTKDSHGRDQEPHLTDADFNDQIEWGRWRASTQPDESPAGRIGLGAGQRADEQVAAVSHRHGVQRPKSTYSVSSVQRHGYGDWRLLCCLQRLQKG